MSNKKPNRKKWLLLLLLLLLLITIVGVLIFAFFKKQNEKQLAYEQYLRDSLAREQAVEDSLNQRVQQQALEDSLRKAADDSLAAYEDSLRSDSLLQDSLSKVNRIDSLERAKQDSLNAIADSLNQLKEDSLRIVDSLARAKEDSIRVADSLASLCSDTIAPWIYPEPSGGVHYEAVNVSFIQNEPATIFWKFSEEPSFKKWDGSAIHIAINEELHYYAVDSCNNSMKPNSKRYVFEKDPNAGHCPDNMEFIASDEGGFCIDQYEWPNRKKATPISNVSFREASDSCFTAGKRLCSSNEWETACRGKYDWDYPYGRNYEQHACVTLARRRKRSGEAGECRGWYAVYDMVGNLAEWTSTPAQQDNTYYIVKGGFWESGNRANCSLERYSYYPQNRHNPVGFRCCKDISSN